MFTPSLPVGQEIFQADVTQQLGPHTIRDAIDDLAAVLRRIDVHAIGPPAERCGHDSDDGVRDRADVVSEVCGMP